ncbi:MAG: septation protein IspZ [Patescibacteria group bacterium]
MLRKLVVGLGVEFGPIIVFFLIAEQVSFLRATLIFVVLTVISLVVGLYEQKRIAWFPLIAGGSVVIFGTLTLIFDNPFFLIAKDTLYNAAFAIALFIGLAHGKGWLKPMFQKLIAMNDRGWRTLSWRWAIFFTILAVTNELARLNLPTAGWIVFKEIATSATIIFSIYQFTLSKKERLPDATPWGLRKTESR